MHILSESKCMYANTNTHALTTHGCKIWVFSCYNTHIHFTDWFSSAFISLTIVFGPCLHHSGTSSKSSKR